jgi:CheY-like chemotaxis protein
MKNKRIYIIDDEENMTGLISLLLGYKGFETVSANHSTQALDRLLGESFDMVILDLMMPGMDGFALIAKLRESPRHDKTPIVALSAKTLENDERKALLMSDVRYVAKPVSPSRLVQIVRDIFKA